MSCGNRRDISAIEANQLDASAPTKKHCGAVANDTALTKDIFPFFGLARELRDLIYDELLERKSTEVNTKTALGCWSISMVPRSTGLCKQFHEEAMQRRQDHVELQIVDCEGYGFNYPRIPLEALQATTLKLRLLYGSGELTSHQWWIEHLLKNMPKLSTTRIEIQTRSTVSEGDSVEVELKTAQLWARIPSLSELIVYGIVVDENESEVDWDHLKAWDRDDLNPSILVWSAETKKLEKPKSPACVST